MLRRVIRWAAGSLLAVVAFAGLAQAGISDLANDFSITTNGGTNPWGYGTYAGSLTPSTLSGLPLPRPAALALDVWSNGGSDRTSKRTSPILRTAAAAASPGPRAGCFWTLIWARPWRFDCAQHRNLQPFRDLHDNSNREHAAHGLRLSGQYAGLQPAVAGPKQ